MANLKHCVVFFAAFLFIVSSTVQSASSTSFFEALKKLEGCHKGQTVSGLSALKSYLIKFGYLKNPEMYQTTNYNHAELFDGELQSALKQYQSNFHLNVSGVLDSETIRTMELPRCGNPDKSHENVGHAHGNGHRKLMSFHITSRYSFFQGSPKWSKKDLTYTFESSSSSNVGFDSLRAISSSAFSRWQSVTEFTFSELPVGSEADIKIGFHIGDHGDGSNNAFDGVGKTWAHAFAPEIGWLHFDGSENWATGGGVGSEQVDLESVAIHEVGHILGLEHSEYPDAVMYAYFSSGTVKRELHQDDLDGITALYSA